MSAASTPAGYGGEVGVTAKWGRRRRSGARDRFGGEVVAGGKPFLVKSKITVARFSERATSTSSSFFPFFIYFSLHFIFFLSPFSISFIFFYFSICFLFYFLFISSSALRINVML